MFYKRFQAYNKSLGLKDVKMLSIEIAQSLSSSRRLLTSYDNIITYEVSTNSTDEAEIQEFLQIVNDVDDDDYASELGAALLNDTDFMEGEDVFDASEIVADGDDQIVISEENEYDPTDPKWCQWQSTTI